MVGNDRIWNLAFLSFLWISFVYSLRQILLDMTFLSDMYDVRAEYMKWNYRWLKSLPKNGIDLYIKNTCLLQRYPQINAGYAELYY